MKKGVLIGGGLVAVVIVIAVVVLLQSLDRLVQASIEHYGTEILGVEVSVGRVAISLREGRGTISGLSVANPPGFSTDEAFTLGEISIGLDLASLREGPVVLNELSVRAPEVSYELVRSGKSNLQILSDNAAAYSGSDPADAGEGGAATEPVEAPRMIIRKLLFEDGQIHARAQLDRDRKVDVPLPALRMSDLGAPSGKTADEIGAQVLQKFSRTVVTAVGRSQAKKQLQDLLGDDVGGAVSDTAGKLLDKLR